MSNVHLIPDTISKRFEVHEWRNGIAILHTVHGECWDDVMAILDAFTLSASEILTPGGSKSGIASKLDGGLYERDWQEKSYETSITVDGEVYDSPSHKVDCVKGRVALEVEWNNKDPFFDRDLNNFRQLFELRAIDVGIIITRASNLQDIFKTLEKGSSYGNSTTHINKLLPRLEGVLAVAVPLLSLALRKKLI